MLTLGDHFLCFQSFKFLRHLPLQLQLPCVFPRGRYTSLSTGLPHLAWTAIVPPRGAGFAGPTHPALPQPAGPCWRWPRSTRVLAVLCEGSPLLLRALGREVGYLRRHNYSAILRRPPPSASLHGNSYSNKGARVFLSASVAELHSPIFWRLVGICHLPNSSVPWDCMPLPPRPLGASPLWVPIDEPGRLGRQWRRTGARRGITAYLVRSVHLPQCSIPSSTLLVLHQARRRGVSVSAFAFL